MYRCKSYNPTTKAMVEKCCGYRQDPFTIYPLTHTSAYGAGLQRRIFSSTQSVGNHKAESSTAILVAAPHYSPPSCHRDDIRSLSLKSLWSSLLQTCIGGTMRLSLAICPHIPCGNSGHKEVHGAHHYLHNLLGRYNKPAESKAPKYIVNTSKSELQFSETVVVCDLRKSLFLDNQEINDPPSRLLDY